MAIPNGRLSTTLQDAPYLSPDDIDPPGSLIDYELGGIGVADASQGLQVQTWTLRCAGGDMILESPATSPQVIFSPGTGVTWVSLAFDQQMQPVIAFTQSGAAKLYWYNPVTPGYETLTLPANTENPCVCMDDKRSTATDDGVNDVILSYVRSGTLYYRQSRDRYEVEYELATGVTGTLTRVGMHAGNRLRFRMV